MIQFHALGGLTVSGGADGGLGGPRQRRLVAMLLIHRNSVVSIDRLADVVFAGEPTPAASTTLRSYVARLRRVVEHDGSGVSVVTRAPGYMLQVPPEAFDVARFEAMLADGGARLARDDAAGAASVLRQALELWSGGAYAEFADEDWALPEARRLCDVRLVAHERLVDAELRCGRSAEVVPQLEALVAEEPMRESFRLQLATALYRSGRQVDALRVITDYRRVLREELGLDPSPELVELERRVLNHDPALMPAESAGTPLRGYRLGERLGTGRNGTVYSATLPGVDRQFAIRVTRAEIADCPQFVRTFEAAAHLVASLRHPAIVPIHDYWREPGAAYLVMRRMRGGTLTDLVRRGRISVPDVANLVVRVGGALVAAAEHGIVHGNVSADSVLYDEAGLAHLGDFTLAAAGAGHSPGDDVHDFAAMVGDCLAVIRADRSVAQPDDAVAEVVTAGLSTSGRPPMAEFVARLATALTGPRSPGAETRPRNPYKGLRAFDEADADDYFGRDDLVDDILARLAGDGISARLVLVVGASGTGKSSVVHAGLLPRVRRGAIHGSERWFVATMLPGSSPFKELSESLRHVAVAETVGRADQLAAGDEGIDLVIRRIVPDDGQLLLVVDQFEELFTMATEEDQRAFLDGLIHAVRVAGSRLRVVATMRADFYDRPLAFQRFGAAVNEATVTIAPMSPADLEAAIVEPAERAGGRVEPALAAELVSSVVNEPAALPSLQFTLFELAERSADGVLTLDSYRALGGVDGAIAARAEQLYRSLDDDERAAIRRIFEHLVVIGTDGDATRRRATRIELAGTSADPAVDELIDRWSQARLLTLDRHPQTRMPTVEVAHEALLREWPRLRRWIDEDRDAIVVRGNLRDAAASWVGLDRDPGALYRGARLQVALDVAGTRIDDLPAAEREFLDASRHERDREQRETAEQIKRQARANRRLRIQLVALAAALVVALVGGYVAVDQRRDAQRERRAATARELAAAADLNLADESERSMLLALAAIDQSRSGDGTALPQAVEALHRAVASSRIELTVPGIGGWLDWSPAGDVFVTEGPEGSGLVEVRDARTGEPVRSWRGHDDDVNDVAFSSNGSLLATTGDDGAVRVWDPETGEELSAIEDEEGGVVFGATFSHDGSLVAASWTDHGGPGRSLVRVVDIPTDEVVLEIESEYVQRMSFDPRAERLALGNLDGYARVVDVDSGASLFDLPADVNGERDVQWSPDGRWIATTGFTAASIWDADTGEQSFTLAGHAGQVNALDWSSDSTRLATAGEDGTARVWDVAADGVREVLVLAAQSMSGGLADVAFSADGDRLMIGDWAVTAVQVFDVSEMGRGEWTNVPAAGLFPDVDFMPDGASVVASGDGGTVARWDVETGERLATFGPRSLGDGDAWRVDVSPDGEFIATVADGPLDVWSAMTGELVFSLAEEDWWFFNLAWSPDADVLAVSQVDADGGRLVFVDRAGDVVATIEEDPGFHFRSVSFSPDGGLVAGVHERVDRDDPTTATVRIWDWANGEIVDTIETPAMTAVFDPTGGRLATTRWNSGEVDVWDMDTDELVATLTAPAQVWRFAFGPDGSRLATAHGDGTVRVWDVASGLQQLSLPGHRAESTSVAFSPDGRMLASAGADRIVRVWALELDDLVAIAHDRLTRWFTDDECRQYLHLERCPAPA